MARVRKSAARKPVRTTKAAADPAPSKTQDDDERPSRLGLVVGMGASAGGLEAFQKFFSRMPTDSGMAFVLAQHLDPRHETMMPELLGRTTSMPVSQVRDETPAQQNHVYVIPPNAVLTIEGGVLRVKAPPGGSAIRMPIDSLFHSLAEDQGANAVCILLSGSGSDGTLGLRAVKEHGGLALAQTPESAKHDAILRSAIGTGMVDHVLRPEEMPAKLQEYAAYLRTRRRGHIHEELASHLTRIYAQLRRKTGHDFTRYKPATVIRRIQRRMQVLQLSTGSAYVERLRQDPKEVDQLFRDLLIGVTHFFRDPEAFEALAREAIPRVVERAGTEGSIRIWTPGCATGEEAYSIAMLVREETPRHDVSCHVQIFAGDIDDEALDFARAGSYPEGIAEHVTPQRLARFFVKQDHGYQVAKEIREMCIFSMHNLIRDPPFSRLDLVACRNLLIYLDNELQRHVASLFHYGLRSGGYLFLGPSESLSGPPDLFRVVDKKHRIFLRAEVVTRPPLTLPTAEPGPKARALATRTLPARVAAPGQQGIVAALERLLLDQYAPAWVIVNALGETIYFSPRTGRFLEPAPGTPSLDILAMARKGLRLDLRTALHKVIKSRETVEQANVRVETNGDVQRINLVVRPLVELGDDPNLFMVVFQELGPAISREQAAAEGAPEVNDQLVQQLESELRTTKDHLKATVEELETSNEELKSSNEELLSTNEELQSANEELQTSKEEMQSVNEELETINAELRKKVEELDVANSDLQNLLRSTQIPTLFLDNQLRIKRFTEAATAVFHLIESDVGRPITDIAVRFDTDITEDFKEVLRTLSGRDRQVRAAEGSASYLMRTLPYRRVDNVIDGLVITLLDITQLEEMRRLEANLASIIEGSQDAIVGGTFDGTITSWNPAASRLFGYSEQEARGRKMSLIVPEERTADTQAPYEQLKRGEVTEPFESVRRARDGREVVVSVAISPMKDSRGQLIGASAIFRDVTGLKKAEEALRAEVRHTDQFLAQLSHELRNPLAPLRTCLDVLRTEGTEAQADSCLQIMDRQLNHLTGLVEQLLDASRIASGKIVLEREDVDFTALVRAAVQDHRAQVEGAGLKFQLDLPVRELRVHGDRLRLSQVVANLLGNAVKFSQTGAVRVSLRADAERRRLTLSVKDDGIGVPSEMLPRLFRPFSQGESAGRMRRGLGLGLALVRTLVEAHQGVVEARSEGTGKGSEFVVRLPLEPEPHTRRGPEMPLRRRRVLVVEDQPEAAEGMRILLEVAGQDVKVAPSGPAALEIARRLKPEIVFCDIGLPGGMDGYAVAAALRSKGEYGRPFLVAVTGYGQADDRERARVAGFDQHLKKPADGHTIRWLLAELPAPD